MRNHFIQKAYLDNFLGKEGDVYLYSFVLDIYINNTSSKKANFTVRFKDDLFIGYDNSELIRL